MGRYNDIVKANYNKIRNDEAVMWGSIAIIDTLLEEMAEHHKERYWKIMRDTHELMHGRHFDKEYAEWQVAKMHHKCGGEVYKGEHWSYDDTTAVMSKYRSTLPSEVTPCDFYVALNAQWHDYHCWAKEHFADEVDVNNAIIEGAVAFWFKDEDYPSADKVWNYFRMMNK